MQLAAGKNDFTDKENLKVEIIGFDKAIEEDNIKADQAPFEVDNKAFYHEHNKPGKIIDISDRSYVVAPNGSWYRFNNEEEYNDLVYNKFKTQFM